MVLGRFLGTFIAVSIVALFPQTNIGALIAEIIFLSIFGTILGMLGSIIIGPNISKDIPTVKDGEQWWIDKYGEEMGRKAYQLWLKDL